ncbi:endocellulase [Sanghuangporus baumii]|uniref:Endocellulase n=1 Tax=Sanghuangporus baumii TaxID=108892 RepID=A0A9Q5I4X9_SANBA|nr:endocellulase [Sanghuangporus baumii]
MISPYIPFREIMTTIENPRYLRLCRKYWATLLVASVFLASDLSSPYKRWDSDFLATLSAGALAQTITGRDDCLPAGNYLLCQNLWGAGYITDSGVGNQNSTLISTNDDVVSWSTAWTWFNNEKQCQSLYGNLLSAPHTALPRSDDCLNTDPNVEHLSLTSRAIPKVGSIVSAPTTWDWRYTVQSPGIRANVAYDLWIGPTTSGTPAFPNPAYEIMIWLSGKGGVQPVGSPATSPISLAGHNWDLWRGPNQNWEVLSFVILDGDEQAFSADLNEYTRYLIENQGMSSSQVNQLLNCLLGHGVESFPQQVLAFHPGWNRAIHWICGSAHREL